MALIDRYKTTPPDEQQAKPPKQTFGNALKNVLIFFAVMIAIKMIVVTIKGGW